MRHIDYGSDFQILCKRLVIVDSMVYAVFALLLNCLDECLC